MTRARELGKLANRNSLTADNTNNFVGIGSTQPDARLDVDGTVLVGTAITLGGASGIVSATSFYGDGSNLDGVASAGLGTALSEEGVGSVIYYTENTLGIGSTFVVTVPTGSDVAYTQYAEVSLDENVDLIVTNGDDFVPDILGLSTTGITTSTGIGGRIRAGTFTNKAGTGAPQLTFGAEIPVGYGLTGAGGINVGGAVTAASGNFTGAVTVGGVLTYEDVTNIDSLGIITARSGLRATSAVVGGGVTVTGVGELVVSQSTVGQSATLFLGKGGPSKTFAVSDAGQVKIGTNLDSASTTNITLNADGSSDFAGDMSIADKIIHTGDTNTAIRFPAADTFTVETAGSERLRVTSTGGVHFTNGELIERAKVTAGKLSDNTNIDLENGMVHLFTTQETTTSTPNIRINSSTSLNSVMAVGEMISVTLITTAAAAGYSAQLTIDGNAVTENWTGGSAPDAGGSSGVDIHAYTIIKTADATFTVIATQTTTS
jgi:hypothetical protein